MNNADPWISRDELRAALGGVTSHGLPLGGAGLPAPQAQRKGTPTEFQLQAVLDWRAENGIDGTVGSPGFAKAIATAERRREEKAAAASAEPVVVTQVTADPAGGRATLARADLANKAIRAKRADHELKVEQALPELQLGERIRALDTVDDLVQTSKEIAALIGDGSISVARGRALRDALSEARQAIKLRMSVPVEDPERIYLLSADGALLVQAFERIVADERRAAALQAVRRLLEDDVRELPAVDPVGAL